MRLSFHFSGSESKSKIDDFKQQSTESVQFQASSNSGAGKSPHTDFHQHYSADADITVDFHTAFHSFFFFLRSTYFFPIVTATLNHFFNTGPEFRDPGTSAIVKVSAGHFLNIN